jgi:uncharacterized protein
MEPQEAEHELAHVTAVLAGEADLVLAIAFGSLVAGQAGTESDVDVGLLTEGPLDDRRRERLVRAIAQATGRPVDLVDLRSAGVPLLRTILTTGTVLLRRDGTAHAQLVSRMLADVEDFLPLRERLLRERRQRWIG